VLPPGGGRAKREPSGPPRGAEESRMSIVPTSPLVGVTIVIVEDHDDSRDAMAQIIAATGATVLEARDGAAALALITEHRPDLVLCDVRMPGTDGFWLLKQIRGDEHLRGPFVGR